MSGRRSGKYDLEFRSQTNNWIKVEVWGEKPAGHQSENYADKKAHKEAFNRGDSHFFGIDFRDCYNETRLAETLEPFIGEIQPFVFGKPTDKLIPSTNWSNSDELLEYCREFTKSQPGGVFPNETWLRKRRQYATRKGPAYNTLAIYITKWIGGVRKLREILGQSSHNMNCWNKDTALKAYKDWFEKYALTPAQVKNEYRRGRLKISPEEYSQALRLQYAIEKYVGSMDEVYALCGIKPKLGKNCKSLGGVICLRHAPGLR